MGFGDCLDASATGQALTQSQQSPCSWKRCEVTWKWCSRAIWVRSATRAADENSVIYFGAMGLAGYQGLQNRSLPRRNIHPAFDDGGTRALLRFCEFAQPFVRSLYRRLHGGPGPRLRRSGHRV